MKQSEVTALRRELTSYLDDMVAGLGRTEWRAALRLYLQGLLLDGERKSLQPMAARLAEQPDQADAVRQRLQQAVAGADRSPLELFRRFALMLQRKLPGIDALVVDDTGFLKKGSHSVGVARQYSGTWGRTDNGQVATSLHLASEHGSGMISMQLYLPKAWTADRPRCDRAGVPERLQFMTKWQIALSLIDHALAWGIRRHPVVADAGYGDIPDFRDGLEGRGLGYVLGISGSHCVWPPGARPAVPKHDPSRMGRPRTRPVDPDGKEPLPIAELARMLSYERVEWREGSAGPQWSRFAAVRVRTAERYRERKVPEEVWLICEWSRLESEPAKYYVSNLGPRTPLEKLVKLIKRRWRVERDYQEMKGELGLDHYEGRKWSGFHHHAALCALAHGFLTLRRALSPPEEEELDAAGGEAGAPAGPAGADRLLPNVPAHY